MLRHIHKFGYLKLTKLTKEKLYFYADFRQFLKFVTTYRLIDKDVNYLKKNNVSLLIENYFKIL